MRPEHLELVGGPSARVSVVERRIRNTGFPALRRARYRRTVSRPARFQSREMLSAPARRTRPSVRPANRRASLRTFRQGGSYMLKGINPLLNADVLCARRAMGHGDDRIIADANFPFDSIARQTRFGKLLRIQMLLLRRRPRLSYRSIPSTLSRTTPPAAWKSSVSRVRFRRCNRKCRKSLKPSGGQVLANDGH